jgi:hypothetical protein
MSFGAWIVKETPRSGEGEMSQPQREPQGESRRREGADPTPSSRSALQAPRSPTGHDARSTLLEVTRNADRIARELGLRGSRQQLPGRVVEGCHRILAQSRDNPDESIYGRLVRTCQGIRPPHKRHFLTCLILLDRLWLVRSGSKAAADVVRLIRESYQLCEQPTFKAILQGEFLEKQWSSFPLVRQTASQIVEIQKVSEAEVRSLHDEHAFPDIRTAIARRILLHQQKEFLPELLAYLIEASEHGQDAEEKLQAEGMIAKLRDFGMSVVLVPLFQAYVAHFANQTVRGYLMRALSSFGEPLVPQLENLYRNRRDTPEADGWRLPIIRLLRQMISRGHPAAARALGEIVFEAKGGGLDEAGEHLLKGARERAARGVDSERTLQISEYLKDLGHRLSQRAREEQPEQGPGEGPESTLARLGRELIALSWDAGVTQELVERVVAGLARLEEKQQLRWGGVKAAEKLAEIIQDEHRAERQRLSAMEVLPTLFGNQGRAGPEEMLWRIYRRASSEELRLGALGCLARLELPPPNPDEARRTLYEDFHRGTPAARQAIVAAWPALFPDAPALADRSE